MSIERFMNTEIKIKRKSGVDKYGKPQYTQFSLSAKVEEELRKVITTTGEELMGLTIIYTKDEIKPDDLISTDNINYYPLLNISVVRNVKGEIVFYKGYLSKGAI